MKNTFCANDELFRAVTEGLTKSPIYATFT